MAKKVNLRAAIQGAAPNPTMTTAARFEAIGQRLEERPTGLPPERDMVPARSAAMEPEVTTPTLGFTRETADAESGEPHFEVVPIDLIDDNVYNARNVYLPQKVHETAETLRSEKQLVPGIAVRRGARFMLIAGHYRLRGLKVIGAPTMKLMVYENLSDRETYLMSYSENIKRSDQTALDNALAWSRLLESSVYETAESIGTALGLSKSAISKTLSILKLSEPTLDLVRENPSRFALTTLYELLLLQNAAGEAEAFEMAREVVENEAGRAEVAARRDLVLAVQARREAAAGAKPVERVNRRARLYQIWSASDQKREVGNIREWDSGRLMIETTIADPQERAQFMEAIKNLRLKAES